MENTPPLAGEPTDLWDWENLFNFPLNPDEFNSDIADDQLLRPWPSSGSGDPPEPSESVAEPAPIEDSVEGSNRVRKRDPRLICPNFIAGVVPCACPELDELAAAEEAEAELAAGPKKRVRKTGQIEIRCQVPGCEADIKELKGYHRRHKVCLACATATYVVLEGQQKRYCQQCGKFHLLPDFDEGKRSCRRKLERHNKRRRRKPNSKNETEIDDQVDLLSNLTGDTIKTSDEINQIETSNLEKENSNGEDISPLCTLLPSMQNELSNSILSVDQEAKLDNNNNINDINNDGNNDNNEKPSHSSLVNENKSAYSSSCPTGRISFKLYDWNPAEFPRRLRHQIFEWLSSMPVELEGYIRPGCTILTLFIAMPQFMWDKLSRDADSIVKNLVNAPGSLLLNKGSFLIYLDNMIIQIMKDGTSLMNIKMEVHAPKIHYVYPSFFEVGKNIEFIICGSFLHQPKFRSLVSFNGKYVKHKCNIVEYNKSTGDYNNKDDYFNNNNGHEMFRISISDTEPDVFGPAFIEVDNVSGLSNFVPILFGTKNLCTELKKIQEEAFNPTIFRDHDNNNNNNKILSCELLVSKQKLLSQLILDIAWLQKKTNHVNNNNSSNNNNNNNNNNKLSPPNIERLTCLLRFLISKKLINILEIVLCSLDNILFGEILSNLENGKHDVDVAQFLELINHARDCLNNRNKFDIRPPLLTQGNEENSCSTSEPESETVSLVPRQRVLNRENCRPQLGRGWALSYPSGPTRARFAAVVMVGVLVCVTACTVLFHPHEPGSFAISVRKLLNFNG